MNNVADLYQPIHSSRSGTPPVIVNAVVTAQNDYVMGGVPQSSTKTVHYVLLSALPKELQDRVVTAVQALISGM